jgi:hypothetical protein
MAPVVETRTVEVPTPVYKALSPKLTALEPVPPRPALNCVVDGKPTLCNRDLADWLLQYDAALARINARMLQVQGLQP